MTQIPTDKLTVAAIFHSLLDLRRLDRLGGSDSFFGRQHILETLLKEAHMKAGERWHGMNRYMNCISFEPTQAAIRAWKELGYSFEELGRQSDFWMVQGTPDAAVFDILVRHEGPRVYRGAAQAEFSQAAI